MSGLHILNLINGGWQYGQSLGYTMACGRNADGYRIGVQFKGSFTGTESLCQLDLGSHASFLPTQIHLSSVGCHLARKKGLEFIEPNSEVLVLAQLPLQCDPGNVAFILSLSVLSCKMEVMITTLYCCCEH